MSRAAAVSVFNRRLTLGFNTAVGFLIAVALAAAVLRLTVVTQRLTSTGPPRMSPIDERAFTTFMDGMRLTPASPEYERTRAGLVRGAEKFNERPVFAFLHLIPALVIVILAPLQFWTPFRQKHLRLHRRAGRVLLILGTTAALTGGYFTAVEPQFGFIEKPTIAFFVAAFIVSAAKGYAAIRRRDIARHREWMIRMFAMALGIATVRLAGTVLTFTMTAGYETIGVAGMWLGWTLTLAAAELWIRHTRPRRAVSFA